MGKASRNKRRAPDGARRRRTGVHQPAGAAQPGGRAGSAFYAATEPPGPSRPTQPTQPGPTLQEIAEELVGSVVQARAHGADHLFDQLLATMARANDRPGWQRVLRTHLITMVTGAVTAAWARGWQPADVVRVAGRRLGDDLAAGLLVDLIAVEGQGYATATVHPRWRAQLEAIEATPWWPAEHDVLTAWIRSGRGDWDDLIRGAVDVYLMIVRLPGIDTLMPPPGATEAAQPELPPDAPTVPAKILERVRLLLAKAESTPYPAEAETLTAGAQSLMARHRIDEALLAATAPGRRRQPDGRRVGIDNPYEQCKALLLTVVAKANGCRSVWSKELGFSTVLGFASDLDAVEMLFTSIRVQATTAMIAEGARTDRWGGSRTRSFRQAFLTSYATRIGERLQEASDDAVHEATEERAGQDLLPVLAAREEAVEEALAQMFPATRTHSVGRRLDAEGWDSGRAAADLATLSGRRSVGGD